MAAPDPDGSLAAPAQWPSAARPGNHLPEVPAQRAGAALRQRRGAGRRPTALRRGTADPGKARGPRRAIMALGPAQPDGRGAAGNGAGTRWIHEWRRRVVRAATDSA